MLHPWSFDKKNITTVVTEAVDITTVVTGLVEPTPQTILFSGILRNHSLDSGLWTLRTYLLAGETPLPALSLDSGTAINHSLELVSYKMKHPSFHMSNRDPFKMIPR